MKNVYNVIEIPHEPYHLLIELHHRDEVDFRRGGRKAQRIASYVNGTRLTIIFHQL